MQVHDVQQGSQAWHTLRAQHFCASDAAAAMGVSKYKQRGELLRQKATGYVPEVDAATQRRFDGGHAAEATARPIVEAKLGEELFPCVGTREVDGLPLLASFDGLTMMGDVAWETKQYNADLADQVARGELEAHYWTQLEQALLVSGAEKVWFTTTDGTAERMAGMWYESIPERRAQVIAAWQQFAKDLAEWKPGPAPAEKMVADPVEALPAPVIQVSGQLALQDNFKVFEDRLRDFLDNRLIREPKTDEDFVNLDAQIKAMKAGREALKSAKAQMLAQVQPIDLASKTADMLDTLLQKNCKMAEDLLKDEKDRRRDQIVIAGKDAFTNHVAALNKRLGRHLMPNIPTDFGGCVRGLKSLSSMEDKVNTHLANAKIAANDVADKIQINLDYLREHAKDHAFLFADTATIVLKAPDDLAALVQSRIGAHQKAEADRLERERARIAEEERVKAEAKVRAEQEAAAKAELDRRNAEAKALEAVVPPAHAQPVAEEPAPVPAQTFTPPAPYAVERTEPVPAASPPTMTNGKVCQILGFNVTADFLVSIGAPAPTKQGNANLWHDRQILAICEALGQHLQAVHTAQKAKYQPARTRTPA